MLILSWASLFVIFAIALWTRFSRPGLTETELLLMFWPRWLVLVIIAVTLLVVARRKGK